MQRQVMEERWTKKAGKQKVQVADESFFDF